MKIVAITGKLSKSRKDIIEEFKNYGIQIKSISKATDILIIGERKNDDQTRKILFAQEHHIKVITEKDFRYEYLREG